MMDAEADGDIQLLDTSASGYGLSGISDNISKLERVSNKLNQILDDDAIKDNSEAVYAFYYNLFKKAGRKLTGGAADSATPVVYKSATILNAIADDMLNENPKTKGIFEKVWPKGECILNSSAHKDLMSDLLRRVIFPVEIWYGVLDLDTTSAADIKKGMIAEAKYSRVAKILAGINYTPKDLHTNIASEDDGSAENTSFSSEDASNNVVKTNNDTLFDHLAVYTAAELYGAKSDYFDEEGNAMPGGLSKDALDHIVKNNLLDEDELKSIAYIVKETSIGSGRSYTSTVKAVAFVHVYEDPLTQEESLGYGTGFEKNEAGDIVEKIVKWTP